MTGLSHVVSDVAQLPSARLGTFDFFLDIGCFQGLDARQRLAQAEGACALATGAPDGLEQLTETDWAKGTVLTRAELEDARAGRTRSDD